MPESARIRISCVDDHPLVSEGIAFAIQLQKDIELVGQAITGQQAVAEFK